MAYDQRARKLNARHARAVTDNRKDNRRLAAALIAIALAVVLFRSYPKSIGETLNSRLATAVSLVHYGTWFIDRPAAESPIPFEQRTIDKVQVNERLISSKPPMLSLLMAGEYFMLNRVFGLSLLDADDRRPIVYVMTITFVGIPFVILLCCFWKLLQLLSADRAPPVVPLFALAFCTPAWGYASVFNNHVLAASLIGIFLYAGATLVRPRDQRRHRAATITGLCLGLVPTIDMPAGIFSLAGVAYLLAARVPGRTLAALAAGAAVPILIHAAITFSVTGSLLPVQMREATFLYEASYWRNPINMDALNHPQFNYLLHMTFGRKGLFLLFPVLLGAIAFGCRTLASHPTGRLPIVLALSAFGIVTLFYLLRTNNYGGEAYGFRWYIPAVPVLLLMAASPKPAEPARLVRAATALALLISFVSAWQCSLYPWQADREWTVLLFGPTF